MLAHLAAGYAAKKVAPRTSLGTLLIAGTFIDLLFAPFVLLGIEHARIVPGITVCCPFDLYDYPFSHSLLFTLLWAVLFRMVYLWRHKKDTVGGWAVFGCVLSHWVFDLISHRPDLPILPFIGPNIGFSLWNYPLLTHIAELGLFGLGVGLYISTTRARDIVGTAGLLLITTLPLAAYTASMFSPLPPNITVALITTQLQWLYLLPAFWVDAHRTPRPAR
jgi:hypothetical protein